MTKATRKENEQLLKDLRATVSTPNNFPGGQKLTQEVRREDLNAVAAGNGIVIANRSPQLKPSEKRRIVKKTLKWMDEQIRFNKS